MPGPGPPSPSLKQQGQGECFALRCFSLGPPSASLACARQRALSAWIRADLTGSDVPGRPGRSAPWLSRWWPWRHRPSPFIVLRPQAQTVWTSLGGHRSGRFRFRAEPPRQHAFIHSSCGHLLCAYCVLRSSSSLRPAEPSTGTAGRGGRSPLPVGTPGWGPAATCRRRAGAGDGGQDGVPVWLG